MNSLTRRRFVAGAAVVGLGAALASCAPKAPDRSDVVVATQPASAQAVATPAMPTPAPKDSQSATVAPPAAVPPSPPAVQAPVAAPPAADDAYLAVARGASPEEITRRAVAALGGMERFVKHGYDVIVKPNICNASHSFEYASTTNPEVVATLVRLALAAGAKSVRVMDSPFSGSAQAAYARSGIEEAVKAAGGKMELMAGPRFVETAIPEGRDITQWNIYQPVLEADLVINVPIAKHHSLARLTLAGKNLMGVIDNRGGLHRNLGQRIADIASRVRPQLTVVDAVRILVANGPTGGNLADVKQADTVIASHDWVAADAYATGLFGLTPDDIAYVVAADEMGLGSKELDGLKIAEISL
jgi:uncharacterized protein (DUF362 family)